MKCYDDGSVGVPTGVTQASWKLPVISKQLLAMLVCPEDRSPLELASDDVVASLNEAIRAGRLKNRSGEAVARPLDGALVRQDRRVAYPIVDAIPVMLMDEAISLDQLSDQAASA
jgi:uncharacterized protein YbaR (Trm112 family)